MCPLYISGLIGPGDRKSVQPMAARLVPGEYDQLHHFIADGVWDASPLETNCSFRPIVWSAAMMRCWSSTTRRCRRRATVRLVSLHNMPRLSARRPIAGTLVSLTLARVKCRSWWHYVSSFPRVGRAPSAFEACGRSSRAPRSADQARDRLGGDRPRHCLRCAFRLCACQFRVRLQRAFPSGFE